VLSRENQRSGSAMLARDIIRYPIIGILFIFQTIPVLKRDGFLTDVPLYWNGFHHPMDDRPIGWGVRKPECVQLGTVNGQRPIGVQAHFQEVSRNLEELGHAPVNDGYYRSPFGYARVGLSFRFIYP
jgi:hypothetical protein